MNRADRLAYLLDQIAQLEAQPLCDIVADTLTVYRRKAAALMAA